MPEHLIRLRAGWVRLDLEARPSVGPPGRGPDVTLPITWSETAGTGLAVRLSRSFGLPPLDRACERLALRLADVAGLVCVHLNGQEIARPAPGTSALEVPLHLPLLRRNQLALDIQVAPTDPASASLTRPWGVVALVISAAETSAGTTPVRHPEQNSGATHGGKRDDLLGGTRSRE